MTAQDDNPNNYHQMELSILRLGLSHLTVIRTHILFDHLPSSVEWIIKEKRALVNQFFSNRIAGILCADRETPRARV